MRITKSSLRREPPPAIRIAASRYVDGKDVTKEDVEQANVIIGNVDPSLIAGAEKTGTAPVEFRRSRSLHQGPE